MVLPSWKVYQRRDDVFCLLSKTENTLGHVFVSVLSKIPILESYVISPLPFWRTYPLHMKENIHKKKAMRIHP
jgi:hypothetical protein